MYDTDANWCVESLPLDWYADMDVYGYTCQVRMEMCVASYSVDSL